MAKSDFGEFNPDGTIKRDVTHSAISRRETQPGDVLKRVAGTPYFYRLTAGEQRQLTPDMRAELEAQVKPAKADAKPAAADKEK